MLVWLLVRVLCSVCCALSITILLPAGTAIILIGIIGTLSVQRIFSAGLSTRSYEGEESYTVNLCHKCYTDSLKAKGEKTDKLALETVRGAKGAPWKALENDGKRSIRARNLGILLTSKRIE